MTLDLPRALPDHAAADEVAELACPAPDMSMCASEFLTPPEPPSARHDRLKTISLVVAVLAVMVLGQVLNN